MAATRIYSTAAYGVAAIVAILFGLCPKFGVLVGSIPAGVLGGITIVLYGMIACSAPRSGSRTGSTSPDPINLVPVGGRHHPRIGR